VIAMLECTDIFWHEFYKAAGITLGLLLKHGHDLLAHPHSW
jgi:hypothetical protein